MTPRKPPKPKCPPHQWKFPAEVKNGIVTHVCKRCGYRQVTKQLLTVLTGPERPEIERRFWAKVDVRGQDDCWEWAACRSERGYGNFGLAGRSRPAHRVSFVLAFGWEPPAALHKCDNPPCVNPRHLFGGTQADNMADCAKKWRAAAQMSPALKSTIFALREEGMTQAAIARQVNVSSATVARTLRGTHNPGPFEGQDIYRPSVRPYNPLPPAVREERSRSREITCPVCAASAGTKCRTRGGFVLDPAHQARRMAVAS